jgi:phosphatidylglycerophosphate synthase
MTAGERWAESELELLRAGRLRPRAWARFLVASWRRAAATRQARPELARQARGWAISGLVAGLTARHVAVARGLPAPTRRSWSLWWLATTAMLDWHLGMLEGPDGQPREHLEAADAITLARVGLVPFLAASRDGRQFTALVVTAGASDYLDGRLARRAGATRLGRDLDRAADVAVKVAAAHAARRADWLSPAAATLVAAAPIVATATVATSYFATGHAPATDAPLAARPIAPVLVGGLALAPSARSAANVLVMTASLATLASAHPARLDLGQVRAR